MIARLRVTRGQPGTPATSVEYEVPYTDGLTLLDALIWVRRNCDPSLGVRFSCKANACKECAATIDGRPGYLCAQRARPEGTVTVEPLRKPRWIRDLVTELF